MTTTVQLPTSNFRESAGVFALLSSIWAREVTATTLKSMTQPPFSSAWKEAGGKLPGQIIPELIEELAVDYCQLLIGPKNHVSPMQSVQEQSRFQGDATASMKKYMEMLEGFKPCVDMIDHVAVQLQFASVLMGMADQSKRKLIQGLATAFARDHLQWTSGFFQRVERQAQTDFYQSAARLSRQFLFA